MQAEHHYSTAMQLAPSDGDALFARGLLYDNWLPASTVRRDEASQFFSLAVKADPRQMRFLSGAAIKLRDEGSRCARPRGRAGGWAGSCADMCMARSQRGAGFVCCGGCG